MIINPLVIPDHVEVLIENLLTSHQLAMCDGCTVMSDWGFTHNKY